MLLWNISFFSYLKEHNQIQNRKEQTLKFNFQIIKVDLNSTAISMDAKRSYNTKEALFRQFYLHDIIFYLLQSLLTP